MSERVETGPDRGAPRAADDQLALGGSRHVASLLMRQSLLSAETMAATQAPVVAMLPHVDVVKVSGRIVDGGRARLLPVIEEIVRCLGEHRLVIGTGPGVRARHVLSVGLDLGLPTGVLAQLTSVDSEQNTHIVAALLAPHGVVQLPHAQLIHLLPALLAASPGVVFNGVPPFELWEHPPRVGKIPPNGADVGVFQLAEVYGARSLTYVEDVDGLYTADPAADPEARLIPRATVAEIEAMRLPTLCIDRAVLELMRRAHHCRRLQIVSGLRPGLLARALRGEHVGTLIEAGEQERAAAPARG